MLKAINSICQKKKKNQFKLHTMGASDIKIFT